jgi:hypothetical protein
VASDERERDSEQVLSELSEDLGDLVDELFDDVSKVSRLLRRAFPGTQPDEDEVRARRDKLRRAEVEPGLARLQRADLEPGNLEPTEAEREAARRQEEARGKHTIYAITVRHHRSKPFESDWVGHCQSVRVTLPRAQAEAAPIWTHLGVVKPEDHLLFSIEEIVEGYAEHFGARPNVQRLELVTGARHYDLDRFSPISVFLAYERASDKQASFFVLESGSAQGNPAVLYYAPTMGATVLEQAGFQFTPFACKTNWYTGKLIMNRAKTEPSVLSIAIAQERDGKRHYLELTASFEVVEPGKVVWPVALQIQAALRVFAIAQGMGCKLELWEWGLGQLGRSAFDWIAEPPPRGTPEGYSGCSKTSPELPEA